MSQLSRVPSPLTAALVLLTAAALLASAQEKETSALARRSRAPRAQRVTRQQTLPRLCALGVFA
jgi:hypothetical protein